MNGVAKVVFLDKSTLPVEMRALSFLHEWYEYPDMHGMDVVSCLQGANVAITNKVPLSREVLSQLPSLRLIAVAATGYNVIDLEACKDLGIAVCNVKGYSTKSVAEHTIMSILMLSRKSKAYVDAVYGGMWSRSPIFCHFDAPISDLSGKTLGIVGRGDIGIAVARLAEAFGMNVRFAERKGSDSIRHGYFDFDEVLHQSDFLSLHCPYSAENHHLINGDCLFSMKKGGFLINHSRGGLVDELALAQALLQGHLAGAALDVLGEEPPKELHPLLNLNHANLLITPHVAWSSEDSLAKLAEEICLNIEAFFAMQSRNRIL